MADVGTGTTLSWETGFLAEILSVSHGAISREAVNTSHMGTTNFHTFMPGDLTDPGELTVEVAFDPSETVPWGDAAATCTVTFPDSSTWAASGFLTGFEYTDPLEDKMTATCTIKFSGTITQA